MIRADGCSCQRVRGRELLAWASTFPRSFKICCAPLEVTACHGPFPVLTVMLAAMAGLNNANSQP